MTDLPIAAVSRIAKAHEAERVGADAKKALEEKTEDYIGQIARETNRLAAHAGRKTLKAEDIEMVTQ